MTLVCRFLHLALVAATATFLSCGAPSQESPDLSVEDSNVSNDTDASGFDTWDTLPDMASDTMVDVPLDGFDMADESDSTNGLVLPPLGFESGKFEFEVKEMDNTVSELVQAWIDGGQEAVEDYADEHDIQLWNGDLQLMIRHPERDGELLVSVEDLVAAGGEVLDTYDDTTWMAVPLAGLYELTMTVEIGLMDNIWIPLTPVVEPLSNNLDPMMIPDWALEATGMLSCLEAGVQGAGVKIAILDSGFLFATKMVEEGLLPEGTNVMYPSDGLPADWVESPHGSAVAQIVHRSAPGARLVLLTVPNTEVSLNKAVEWCIQNDVDVINASWGRYNQSFYDGQGPVSAAARKAWDNGIVWVSASGNLGSGKSWRGGWTDQDDDGLLDFAPGENFNEFTLKEGESARVFLTWDKWPSTTMSSLTLCLEAKGYPEGHPDDITTQIKCAPAPKFGKSPATQLMMKRTEDLCHEEPDKYYCTTDDFRLAVQATGVMGNMLKPDEGVGISLLVSSNASGFHLEHSTSAGSLADPACQEDIITVGAVHEEDWAQGIVAPYSSHGPTNGGIQKPELVGPSGVFVAFSPSAKGTSFSAPYVTAAAA